ncbi:alpha/beta hydrolase [Paraliomyxa miuraensis]|uniref:alpha/beta hydrolase n=1 Tax=Paraliomyxa miuraensis TaxID=376150 RepID=UPI00225C12ED|nr:alpha/beta fold hydrolase [Paraliomyxa miuraensis]MCX4240271.1 alpha/beta fold hydrolase [Paraliomyxa miuraensis]
MSAPSSTGSADPSSALADPRPIHHGDGAHAVLLLHGLTGTPYDVAPFADALSARGFAVRAPLLAGHTDLATLETTSWRDWYASAEAAFDELHAEGRRRVVVLGFSLGSLLALRLGALRGSEITGLIAISVPLEVPSWQRIGINALARLRTTPGLGRIVGMLPSEGPDVRVERVFRQSPSLRGFPFPSLAELVALQDEVTDLLPYVRPPLLLLHGQHDHRAPVELADRVAQRVGSRTVHKIILPRSFHIIAHDLDRERARDEIVGFCLSVLGRPVPPPTTNETNPETSS